MKFLPTGFQIYQHHEMSHTTNTVSLHHLNTQTIHQSPDQSPNVQSDSLACRTNNNSKVWEKSWTATSRVHFTTSIGSIWTERYSDQQVDRNWTVNKMSKDVIIVVDFWKNPFFPSKVFYDRTEMTGYIWTPMDDTNFLLELTIGVSIRLDGSVFYPTKVGFGHNPIGVGREHELSCTELGRLSYSHFTGCWMNI